MCASQNLFAQNIGVTAVVSEFAENLQIHPAHCALASLVTRHNSVQWEAGNRFSGRSAGLAESRGHSGNRVVVGETERLVHTLNQA